MRRLWSQYIFTAIVVLQLAIALFAYETAFANDGQQSTEPTNQTVRLLIKFDQSSDDAFGVGAFSAGTTAAPMSVDSSLSAMGWNIIDVPANQVEQITNELGQLPGIIEVTPDYPLKLTWEPADPGYQQRHQWSLETIGTEIAWEFSKGQDVVVAVLDTGIDTQHPEFKDRLVPGYNFVDDNTDVTDQCGHGTHVAGIVAAQNNDLGGIGIAHQAKIMPIKVIGETCRGSHGDLMKGIQYAVDQGVRIIVITSGSTYEHTGIHDALIYAREKGALVIVSAGNNGSAEPFYPGSFSESFTVAGTIQADGIYTVSTYGEQIDISAPAVDIYGPYWSSKDGSTYVMMYGTSMAAPHVAAVAALVLSLEPDLTVEELENRLTTSAVDLGSEGWDEHYGWGRISAWGAVAQSVHAQQEQSQATSNVLEGHVRITNLYESTLSNLETQVGAQSITLTWQTQVTQTVSPAALNPSEIVIYRSTLPVFESAEAIVSIDTPDTTIYEDTQVVAEETYHYWLVQAEDNIELTATEAMTATFMPAPAIEPIAEPIPEPVASILYMPLLNR